MPEIPKSVHKLEKVIQPHLDGGKLLTYTTQYLSKNGNSDGSILLSIFAKIQTRNGSIQKLHLVGKQPPISKKLLWRVFQPERHCQAENAVYIYLMPAIKKLQLEAGMKPCQVFDGAPKYYGSRLSLKRNAIKADENAILVQENLIRSGFVHSDCCKKFDLPEAKLLLQQVAYYHALPIALRIKKPHEFDNNIRPHFKKLNLDKGLSKSVQNRLKARVLEDVAVAISNDKVVLGKFKKCIAAYKKLQTSRRTEDGPYTTIAHFDMWIPNFMFRYNVLNRPVKVKLIDFRCAQYESLAYDVIFLMFSSFQTSILENYMEELLDLYYFSFISCLLSVEVDTSQYTFQGFKEEIRNYAPAAICASIFLISISAYDDTCLPTHMHGTSLGFIANSFAEGPVERIGTIIRLAQRNHIFFDN